MALPSTFAVNSMTGLPLVLSLSEGSLIAAASANPITTDTVELLPAVSRASNIFPGSSIVPIAVTSRITCFGSPANRLAGSTDSYAWAPAVSVIMISAVLIPLASAAALDKAVLTAAAETSAFATAVAGSSTAVSVTAELPAEGDGFGVAVAAPVCPPGTGGAVASGVADGVGVGIGVGVGVAAVPRRPLPPAPQFSGFHSHYR
ncbi:hypothetical protein D3C75_794500 [compost metagenome]